MFIWNKDNKVIDIKTGYQFEDIDWKNMSLSLCGKLSENFIREFKDKVNWYYISRSQKLSESFIREYKDEVDWYYISISQKLSENFIREFKNEVDWYHISYSQKLLENFIREMKDKVNWYNISKYQKLSDSFILEFKDKLFDEIIDAGIEKSFIKSPDKLEEQSISFLTKDFEFKYIEI